MDRREWLTAQFEANRPRLRALAYRMLGSRTEADDAVQETWLRLDRTGRLAHDRGRTRVPRPTPSGRRRT